MSSSFESSLAFSCVNVCPCGERRIFFDFSEEAKRSESTEEESFNDGLLEYPQYTLPYDYEGYKIPQILFSGNHEAIKRYRKREQFKLTRTYRKDLFDKYKFTKQELKILKELDNNELSKLELRALEKGKRFLKEE